MAAASALAYRWGAMDMTAHWRPLQAGDVFRRVDGEHFYVQYVNSSGAYVVPLRSNVREINGHAINFTGGGTTISANAVVQIIHPLELGGHSQEYANYVKLEAKSGRKVKMADTKGTAFGAFDDQPLSELEEAANEANGQVLTVDAATAAKAAKQQDREEKGMAKKAKAAAKRTNGAKKDKAPKTVRQCTCGCGGETTGYFVPGHDARFHGWLKKLGDGRIDIKGKDAKSGDQVIPAAVIKKLDLVSTKDGAKAKAPHFYQEAH